MSIRDDARTIIHEAEEAIGLDANSVPNAELINRAKRLLAAARDHYISDLQPELDWRRRPIPSQWTLQSIRELASESHETARKHDSAIAPALATSRLGKF